MVQLGVINGIIEKKKLDMRRAPCNCTLDTITCTDNSNCARFATTDLPPNFCWRSVDLIPVSNVTKKLKKEK